MDEDQKLEVALFRYGVISDIVAAANLPRMERCRMIQEKSSRKWNIPYSQKTRISMNSIRRWIRDYNKSNQQLAALYPKPGRVHSMHQGCFHESRNTQ